MYTYEWKSYNSRNNNLAKKIISFNKKNNFNYIENNNYNHIRDIFCIAILFNKKKSRKTKVLDYGSNLLALSNISSKIDTKSFIFSIYDPFYIKKYKNIKNQFLINFFTDKSKLKSTKFDIINFGSSLQYLENIELLNNTINFKFVKTILITHTPISLSKSFKSKQKNHKNLIQNVHSLNSIKKYFNKFGFNLVFKSRNDEKYIACKTKKKTYSLNLIFIKEK